MLKLTVFLLYLSVLFDKFVSQIVGSPQLLLLNLLFSFMSLVLRPLSPQSSISRTEAIVPTQVDACPRAFGVILNWLRYRQLILGNVAAKEVFYCLLRN